jgi:hypothetical protein
MARQMHEDTGTALLAPYPPVSALGYFDLRDR